MHATNHADLISIPELRSALRGEVIGPADAGYDTARSVFLTGLDHRPVAIIRPADAADVAGVIAAARDTGLELAVRSGGHSVAGHGTSDGGIVLDLSSLRRLDIDADNRTAWADAGLTAGEYTAAVGAHGLATGFGDTASVGIGGITLAGGIGFLHRKFGLTIDSLIAAEVVTADGQLLRADANTHPDLFWAIRGGGGNFGVVTRFQYRLHEVGDVVGGMLVLPATADVVASFIAAAEAAPAELSGMINIMPAPPMPFFPPEIHGRPILMAMLVHAGPVEAGERVFATLRAIATPLADQVRPLRYPQIYEGPEPPHPVRMALQTFFMDTFDRSTADTILDGLQHSSAPMRVAQIRVLGGAVARVPVDATAFAHRGRCFFATVAAAFEERTDAPQHQAWVTQLADRLRQGEAGAYVAFLGDEGEARVREAYHGATWDRLRHIKAQYDPDNLFRRNQNVPPASG